MSVLLYRVKGLGRTTPNNVVVLGAEENFRGMEESSGRGEDFFMGGEICCMRMFLSRLRKPFLNDLQKAD